MLLACLELADYVEDVGGWSAVCCEEGPVGSKGLPFGLLDQSWSIGRFAKSSLDIFLRGKINCTL